jgi:hypothetical protein
MPCQGSASPCQRRWPVGSSLYCLKPALRARFMRSTALTRPSTLPVRPPKAYSFVSYPCAITGMHACSCDNAHACTHSDGPAYSSLPGANPPWLSGRCLAVTPVSCLQPTQLAVASASSSCPHPFCRRVDTLVGRLSLSHPMPAAWPINLAR